MYRNYLILAWRNLRKNKVFSLINILGLAVGLTCCMLISMYLFYEFSFDKHHRNGERLYQLGTVFVRSGEDMVNANTPAPMGAMMQAAYPEIISSVRIMRLFIDDKTLFQYKQDNANPRSFYETKGFLADSGFFDLFSYEFIEGNASKALHEPLSIVLQDEIARKMFGNEPALDKVIHVSSSTNGDRDLRVTGVFKKPVRPSHIDARFFVSVKGGEMERYFREPLNIVNNNMFHTYFLLRPGTDVSALEVKFPAFIEQHAGKMLKELGYAKKQFLTRVSDLHLNGRLSESVTPTANKSYLYILGSVALFTLLIACINFMNLSTARSARRAAEVGVRKVMGAYKRSLIAQFLGESLLMTLIAFMLALVAFFMLLPLFSQLAAKDIHFTWSVHWPLVAAFFLLAIATGLLAGVYPAFYLSSFQPVKVLKGRIQNSLAAVSLRKGLVVFQFAVSVSLIVASIIIGRQMNYMRNKDLGFVKDQQLIIPLRSGNAKQSYNTLKAKIESLPSVQSVGATYYYPGIMNPSDLLLYRAGDNMTNSRRVVMNYVDADYLSTLGLQPVAGRLFSPDFWSDTSYGMVLNEKAVAVLGFASADEATNKEVLLDWRGETHRFNVVGVVKDFHFRDLHAEIEPFGFQLSGGGSFNYLMAHIKSGRLSNALSAIEGFWSELNPSEPFEYNFLDASFEANYAADNRLHSIVQYFTIIAIFISCLGLFGLATFSAEQRRKEIGIRKVLGASVPGLVAMLSKDFLKLVLIALIIGAPFAAWLMQKWLEDFAYPTSIGWTVFLWTGLLAFLIAFATISVQAIRSAMSNPVNSIRSAE